MKQFSPRKFGISLIVLTALIILAAAGIVLFITARLQQNLLTQQPSYDAATLYSRGVDQESKGDFAAAEKSLEQALQAQDNASYRGELAVVKYRVKKYSESIALYQKLIADGANVAFCWNGTGNAYRDWADTSPAQATDLRAKAVDAYQQAITADPKYVVAYSNLALLYEAENQPKDAVAILDKGVAETGSSDLENIKQRIAQK